MQLPLGFTPSTAMGEADFVETEGNAEALALLRRWPQWPSHGVILCGPRGSGKTHLAHIWAARSGAVFATAPRQPEGRLFVVEDVEAYMGQPAAEEALFHLLNRLMSEQGHVLFTATKPPAQWPLQLPDLRSRLQALPLVSISPPDEVALAAVMGKLFADRQLLVPAEVIEYLVRRIERSYASAHATVVACDAASLATGRAITLPLVREVLARAQEILPFDPS